MIWVVWRDSSAAMRQSDLKGGGMMRCLPSLFRLQVTIALLEIAVAGFPFTVGISPGGNCDVELDRLFKYWITDLLSIRSIGYYFDFSIVALGF